MVFSQMPFRKEVFYQFLIIMAVYDIFYVFFKSFALELYSLACEETYDKYKAYSELAEHLAYFSLTGSIYTTAILMIRPEIIV